MNAEFRISYVDGDACGYREGEVILNPDVTWQDVFAHGMSRTDVHVKVLPIITEESFWFFPAWFGTLLRERFMSSGRQISGSPTKGKV